MAELTFNIKNGYGIGELNTVLKFNATSIHPQQNTNIIYAQNGVMKSSFTRTLRDHSKGDTIKDHIFGIVGSCDIKDDSGSDFPKAQIISIPSFDSEPFSASNASTLLVNSKKREEYNALMEEYNRGLLRFLDSLRVVSGIGVRTTHEQLLAEVCLSLDSGSDRTSESLIRMIKANRDQIEKQPDFILQLPYRIAGSKDAIKFANDNQGVIDQLMKAYEEVKKTASFLRGGFDSGNAQKLAKEIEKSKFFDVDHDLELYNSSTGQLEKVTNIEELNAKIKTDIDIVLDKYPNLRTKFNKMTSDLSTGTRAELKSLLENDGTKEIIVLMNNPKVYKRRLWWGYIKGCLESYDELDVIGKGIEKRLAEILKEAKKEETKWDKVVKQFNNRFSNLPYRLEVGNKHNVVLKGSIPEMTLTYSHPSHGDKPFRDEKERETLIRDRISTGERKAFYLLNVLFEVETAQQSGNKHLVILDDIVDSFDYKNKYAFLEYIHDIATKYDNIFLLILTHNFDFFRLLQFRLFGENYREKCWFAQRVGSKISLATGGQFNVIKYTRDQASTNATMWFSLIPFARNIIEYRCQNTTSDADYQLLSECLHDLDADHSLENIHDILRRELGVAGCPLRLTDKFEDKLLETAEGIYMSAENDIIIQNNLVLAMASRHLAERYMKSQLSRSDIDTAKQDEKNFTRQLFEQFRLKANPSDETINALDRVNLITPEHIHINAFMYEPLIDLGIDELKDLYASMKGLCGIE